MIRFFDDEDDKRIIRAIKEAEGNTSGEIRIHLADQIKFDLMVDAKEVFERLGMTQTEARNGVLVYIVPKAHKFAILGDEGIDQVVPDGFWNDVRDLMQKHFRHKQFADGVVAAVDRIGEKLKTYFPHQGEDDENELPDEISYDN